MFVASRSDILGAGALYYSGSMWLKNITLAKRYASREDIIRDMCGFSADIEAVL